MESFEAIDLEPMGFVFAVFGLSLSDSVCVSVDVKLSWIEGRWRIIRKVSLIVLFGFAVY